MSRPPNILCFLTDDHAAWAMGCAGAQGLHTPSMDHLARQGVRFRNAVTPSPVCSPARASFWTGTLPSWHGVHDHLNHCGHPGIADQATLGDALQDVGYRTGLIGKWHCHTSEDNRMRTGFDRWFSQAKGTAARFGEQAFWNQDQIIELHGHQAPLLTEQAVAFLCESHADGDPFFLCIGYTDTHSPFRDAPERLAEVYRQCDFADIPTETLPACHGTLSYGLDRTTVDGQEAIAQYYATVSMIDEQVGRVLDELDSLGMREDTLVIYTGDHGHNTGHHGIACKGNSTVPQNFIEESLLVPLIAHWPGRFAGGAVVDQPVDHCDTFATLLEAAGASVPDEAPRPGRSWSGLAAQDARTADAWRQQVFGEYGNARMIRTADWKLIRRGPGPNGHFPDELYNLKDDPRETVNCLAAHTEAPFLAELDTRLASHFASYARDSHSGMAIDQQPQHNNAEPWRRQVG